MVEVNIIPQVWEQPSGFIERRFNIFANGVLLFQNFGYNGGKEPTTNSKSIDIPVPSQIEVRVETVGDYTTSWNELKIGVSSIYGADQEQPIELKTVVAPFPSIVTFDITEKLLGTVLEVLMTDLEAVNILSEYAGNTSNSIESRQGALQVIEAYGRNDITIEQLRSASNNLTNLRKEDFEIITDDNSKELENSFNILLAQYSTLLDRGFSFAQQIQTETDTIIIQNLKDALENLLNESVPVVIANINNIIVSFSDNRLVLSNANLDNLEIQNKRRKELLILMGALIDESKGLKIIGGIPINEIKQVII